MMEFEITIDNKQVKANSGETILQVAKRSGVEIPTLCYLKGLTPTGECGMCSVEITYPDGTVFDNDTRSILIKAIKKAEDAVLEDMK